MAEISSLLTLQGQLALLTLIGFFLARKGIINAQGRKCLTALLINVILPANIIQSFLVEFSWEVLKSSASILVISLALQIGCVVLCALGYNWLPFAKRSVYQYGTVCSNGAFLGSALVDGIWGSRTLAAVKNFQHDKGLVADGIVGAKTEKALGVTLNQSSSTSLSSPELNLLARCVYSEARGEPYTGQVAVAAVVLNRVRSSSFPNTVSGVIYQPGAFTAVSDGQINLTPNETAYKAARDALNGWDPTNGCLYYYNPATATSKWIWSLKVELTIGRHSFARA